MARYIKYNLNHYKENRFSEILSQINKAGFSGILILPQKSGFDVNQAGLQHEFYPVDNIINLCNKSGLDIILELKIFESPYLWQHKNFTQPVNYNNIPYYPAEKENYYPVCPNNPVAEARFYNLINRLKKLPDSISFLISELGFPFNWKSNSLIIQYSQPPFCYCPFCMGEFSQYIGEKIIEPEQIQDNIRYWMDWRVNVIYKYFDKLFSVLLDRELIISIPPLSLIDLPFVTAQIPIAFLKDNARIGAPLLHRLIDKKFSWVIRQLDHYDLEMEERDLVPIFNVDPLVMDKHKQLERKDFADVIYSDWTDYSKLCLKKDGKEFKSSNTGV